VVTLWLSHQELAVERNVDVCEELLQGRVGVQEQQPDGSRRLRPLRQLVSLQCSTLGAKFKNVNICSLKCKTVVLKENLTLRRKSLIFS
jgi:hypothetical protein